MSCGVLLHRMLEGGEAEPGCGLVLSLKAGPFCERGVVSIGESPGLLWVLGYSEGNKERHTLLLENPG